jgi:hypothetical protein
MPALKDKTVLIIGRGSGIARSVALAVSEGGGGVIAAGNLPSDGSFLFMSGATALKPAPGMLAVAATNAAVDAITAGLAGRPTTSRPRRWPP